jgi:hypothetical protein
MNDVIDIDGSYFIGANESPHLWRSLTPDKRFLLVVTKSVGKLFRAHLFHRVSGAPQWIGTWWTEIDHPSLTGSEESAQQLAHEKLQTFLTSHAT